MTGGTAKVGITWGIPVEAIGPVYDVYTGCIPPMGRY